MERPKNVQEALRTLSEWLDCYIEYLDEMGCKDEESNSVILRDCRIYLDKASRELTDRNNVCSTLPKLQHGLKDVLYNTAKKARESVNPNYRWCALRDPIAEVWLTDDETQAMTFAANRSKDGSVWNICKIKPAKDGYRTYINAACANGHYREQPELKYLHFDYIARHASVHKIPPENK